MLIRRCLKTLKTICYEYNLEVTVHSEFCSKQGGCRDQSSPEVADHPAQDREVACASVHAEELTSKIVRVHHDCGHPCVNRTLHFARHIDPSIVRRKFNEWCQAVRCVVPLTLLLRGGGTKYWRCRKLGTELALTSPTTPLARI